MESLRRAQPTEPNLSGCSPVKGSACAGILRLRTALCAGTILMEAASNSTVVGLTDCPIVFTAPLKRIVDG
jgi:hypothetical protein